MHQQKQYGVISLLAIVVMATVTSAAIGSSIIVVRNFQESIGLDQATVAYAAAESGLEHQLYVIRSNRDNGTRTLQDAKNELDTHKTGLVGSNANWASTRVDEKKFVVPRIGPDQTVNLDLFEPDASPSFSNLQSITVVWSDDCGGSSWIEITALGWSVTAMGTTFDEVKKEAIACNSSGTPCTPFTRNGIEGVTLFNTNKFYRFTFKTLNPDNTKTCSITNMVVTPFSQPNGGGAQVPIPARIGVKASGTFLKSTSALYASMPWRAPASNLLNFVVFSEEVLSK